MFVDERLVWLVPVAAVAWIALRHFWNEWRRRKAPIPRQLVVSREDVDCDPAVVELVERNSPCRVEPFVSLDENNNEIVVPGLVAVGWEDHVKALIERLRESLDSREYKVFWYEKHSFGKDFSVGVLKTGDPYDVLRAVGTGNAAFPTGAAVVVAKLKEWEQRVPFDIIAARYDLVELELKELPEDVEALAGEVAEFCPDVFQGYVSTVEELAEEIRRTRRIELWWD